MPDVMYDTDTEKGLIWARMPDMSTAIMQFDKAIDGAKKSEAVKIWIADAEDEFTWEKPPLPENVVIMKEAKTRHPPGRLK